MMRRGLLLVIMAALSLLTYLLLAGDGPGSGSVLWAPTPGHGVNRGDVPVLATWLVGQGACLVLWFRH